LFFNLVEKKKNQPPNRADIVEALRKISLTIALIKEKNKANKEVLINEQKIISNHVFPVLLFIN
jgi:hypothetical protein